MENYAERKRSAKGEAFIVSSKLAFLNNGESLPYVKSKYNFKIEKQWTRRRFESIGENYGFSPCCEIILAIMNVYWYCYEAMHMWGVTIGVVDRILINFNRTGGKYFISQ